MDTSDQAAVAPALRRVRRTNEEKRRIAAEAMLPGASVAALGRKHGVNANLGRRLPKRGLLDHCREPVSLLPVTVTTRTVLPCRLRY